MTRKLKRNRFVLYLVLVGLVLMCSISIFIHIQCLRPSISNYQIVREHIKNHKTDNRPKYILLYTNFFDVENWNLEAETVEKGYFKSIRCPVTNCVLTNNRRLLNAVTDYDALVFHVAESWLYSLSKRIPRLRAPHQIYVAANMESPAHTKHLLGKDYDFFNWTMTYRLDSDVIWNYYNFVDIESGFIVAPNSRPQWRNNYDQYFNDTLFEIVVKKSKSGVQFVSHCGALSRRDELIRQVQRWMDVDVYGKCGKLKCPRNSPRCGRMLTDEYYFYFSFENSLCRDYVTEKMYNPMDSYIIPVVFGGANYTKFAPPHSYIDVQQFGTVPELVDHLMYLKNNPKEYIKYFWWKEYYRIEANQPFCDLCTKLHDVSARERVQHYKDIKKWWFDDACQLDPKIKF